MSIFFKKVPRRHKKLVSFSNQELDRADLYLKENNLFKIPVASWIWLSVYPVFILTVDFVAKRIHPIVSRYNFGDIDDIRNMLTLLIILIPGYMFLKIREDYFVKLALDYFSSIKHCTSLRPNSSDKVLTKKYLLIGFISFLTILNIVRNNLVSISEGYGMYPLINPNAKEYYTIKPFILTFNFPFIRPMPFYTLETRPQRGQVVRVLFDDAASSRVSRIVALAGDKVEIKNRELWINDKSISKFIVPEGKVQNLLTNIELKALKEMVPNPQFNIEERDGSLSLVTWSMDGDQELLRSEYGPIVVPFGHVFILGDNRELAVDSRYLGPVPVKDVVGAIETPDRIYETDGLDALLK